jgi:sugar lactone lactonase YvrE
MWFGVVGGNPYRDCGFYSARTRRSRTAMPSLTRRDLMVGAALVSAMGVRAAQAEEAVAAIGAPLELVATFAGRQATGIAVSRGGRRFVNFPRWEDDVALSVAEIGPDGALTPYPDETWNAYRKDGAPVRPQWSFVCVQSVTIDAQDRLWVLDPGAPGLAAIVPGAPKLVCIDLAGNRVLRVYRFSKEIAPQGSYLNDIRVTADGRRAVITNSGAPGCLVTLDVESGAMRRVLVGDPSTQPDPAVEIAVGGRALIKADGQKAEIAADGLMLDESDGSVLFQATTGRTMYTVPLDALFDRRLAPKALSAKVAVAARTFVADGYWCSRKAGRLVTDCAGFAVRRLQPDGTLAVLTQHPRLLWPDSLAEGADGAIYVTASHIPEMKTWQGPGVARTALFRFHPG